MSRRGRLITAGIAALASVVVLAVVVVLAGRDGGPPRIGGEVVLWAEDFDAGELVGPWTRQASDDSRIEVADGPIDGGSLHVTAGPRDEGVAGAGTAWRTEVRLDPATTGAGEDVVEWWGWTMRVGADLQGPRDPSQWLVLSQFHGGGGDVSPVVAVELDDQDRLLLRVRGGDTDRPNIRSAVLVEDLERDRDYRLDFRFHWSAWSRGRTEAWVDGEPVATIDGANLYRGRQDEAYLKLGIYRSASDAGDGTVYFDDVRRSR